MVHLSLSHNPRQEFKKGTNCGLASVRTHFQPHTDSSLYAFCAPSRWRWHADPPACCTDTIMRKLIRAALRWTRVCVRLCCGTAAGRTALGRRRFQLLPGAACASAGRCSGPGSGIARQQAHAQMPRRCEALKRPPPEFHSSGTTASRQYAC